MFTAVTSRVAAGRVFKALMSSDPLLLPSCTRWFGESLELKSTRPESVAVAVRLFSQLAGPSKWTLHGLGAALPGHVATALVTAQPGAARTLTCTGTSLVCMVSTLTAIGAGCW